MRYLFVIDMQEDYVGERRNKKRYPYNTEKLIDGINKRIAEYPVTSVVYITNKFFWEIGGKSKELVNGLKVVSDKIYLKHKSCAFSNERLRDLIQGGDAITIEVVGVDGNYCVAATVLKGIKMGANIIWNTACIGVGNAKKFEKVKLLLQNKGVEFI